MQGVRDLRQVRPGPQVCTGLLIGQSMDCCGRGGMRVERHPGVLLLSSPSAAPSPLRLPFVRLVSVARVAPWVPPLLGCGWGFLIGVTLG